MPLFMDHHKGVEGLTADAVADAHRKYEEIQPRSRRARSRGYPASQRGSGHVVLGPLPDAPFLYTPRPIAGRPARGPESLARLTRRV